ncbi:MAG: glycosyltransferase family 4 protein [Pseudomonadota bacterium]
MDLKGLILSQHDRNDSSAYTHRLRKLARCLDERGMRTSFLYMEDTPPLHKITTASLFLPFFWRTLRSNDFFHCGDSDAGQAMFLGRFFRRGPVMLDVHGDVIAQSSLANEIRSKGTHTAPSPRVRLSYSLAKASADHFLVVSTFQKDLLIREGVAADRISLVRNGVDLELFPQLPMAQWDGFKFGYAGGFQTWQGIDLLLDAFERVPNPAVRLLVAGFQKSDAPLKGRFEARFGPRVELVDRTDQGNLARILGTCSMLVIPRKDHPAIRHAFPTKFAEFAALGRPVLVNDVDETAEFVKRHNCGFTASPTPESMADAMTRAAALPPEALGDMGERARKMAERNFAWQVIGDHYAEVVREAVARFGRGR